MLLASDTPVLLEARAHFSVSERHRILSLWKIPHPTWWLSKKNSVVIVLAADRLENSNVLHGWPGKSDVGDRMEGKEAALLALRPLERPGAKPETSAKWPPQPLLS